MRFQLQFMLFFTWAHLWIIVATSAYYYYMMELFSIEDDDAKELFITQTLSVQNDGNNLVGLIGDEKDFVSPCVSLVNHHQNNSAHYSDISDNEIFDIPCSQKKVVAPDNSDG